MSERDPLVEETLLAALDVYIHNGTPRERQLAKLAHDVIVRSGNDPNVALYLRESAAKILRGEPTWQ